MYCLLESQGRSGVVEKNVAIQEGVGVLLSTLISVTWMRIRLSSFRLVAPQGLHWDKTFQGIFFPGGVKCSRIICSRVLSLASIDRRISDISRQSSIVDYLLTSVRAVLRHLRCARSRFMRCVG